MKHSTKRGLTLALTTTLAVSAAPYLTSSATAAPGKLSLVASSLDGLAFDLDEQAAGDVTVQVTDSVAGSVDVDDAQDLTYHWTVTPFDTTTAAVRVPATGEAVQAVDVTGEFVVPLPAGQAPGTYVLVAGLGPDAAATGAIPAATLLTVKAGEAAIVFDDESPLRVAAGADHPVAGTLELEDGTGLPDRLLDLALVRGSAGSDPLADAVLTSLQVTTDDAGAFETVLSDPAEAGQGTELGGSVQAATAVTPGVGDAVASASLAVDLVSETPPTGSSLAAVPLGGGKPGQALAGQARVFAPDDTFDVDPVTAGVQGDSGTALDPVEGQVVTLSLDHGFFTTGGEELPAVVGEPGGNLVDLGTTLTGVTNAAGRLDYRVAIERDAAFDDDGLVTAAVTVVADAAGDLTGTATADWDTTDPLNGRVSIVLSPADEQVGPVAPALAGDRTYYEVRSLDQFGNPVDGRTVDLAYSGDLDDWDYSDDSTVTDFDTAGDVWVVSFETADIDVTGTWNAPTFEYVDTAGNAVAGTSDVTGSATASFYELDFDASRFAIRSTATDVVAVGSTVSQTVRVLDQRGNPVRGYQVRFFRFGPDRSGSEARAIRTTNARGEATYTFVGTRLGKARITAEVTDGVRTRSLGDVVVFGAPVTAKLVGEKKGGRTPDRLTVTAPRKAAGASVTVYRVVAGRRTAVRTRVLDATGQAAFKVKDRNGKRATTYLAVVRSTATTVADTTNSVKVR